MSITTYEFVTPTKRQPKPKRVCQHCQKPRVISYIIEVDGYPVCGACHRELDSILDYVQKMYRDIFLRK